MPIRPATTDLLRECTAEIVAELPTRPWYPLADREQLVHHTWFLACRHVRDRLPDGELPGVRSPSVVWTPSRDLIVAAVELAEELIPQGAPAVS